MHYNFLFLPVKLKGKRVLAGIICTAALLLTQASVAENRYVGSEACRDCHEEAYENFHNYAKKAHSFEAIRKMREHLTNEEVKTCYECHTTGYGQPGGFEDEHTTPKMANAGCEVCHGPGAAHIESEDADDIIGTGKLSKDRCEKCHSRERIQAFNFKPLLHGGAH